MSFGGNDKNTDYYVRCEEWLDINVNFFYIIKFTNFVMLALFSVLSFGKEQNQWWFIIRLCLEIVFEMCMCLPVVRFVCTACSFLIRLYLLNKPYLYRHAIYSDTVLCNPCVEPYKPRLLINLMEISLYNFSNIPWSCLSNIQIYGHGIWMVSEIYEIKPKRFARSKYRL